MKRKAIFLVALFFATTMITPISASAQEKKGYLKSLIEAKSYTGDNKLFIQWDESKEVPRFISGKLSESPVTSSDTAQKYLQENLDAFNLKGGEFKLINTEKDNLGFTHYKYQFEVDGIAVYGSEIIVHVNKDGVIDTINGQTEPSVPILKYSQNFKISKDEALNNSIAETGLKEDTITKKDVSSVVYENNKTWSSAYQVNLSGIGFNWMVFIDGATGKTIDKYDNLAHDAAIGTGIGQRGDTKTLNINSTLNGYTLENVSGPGKITTTDANNRTISPGTVVQSSTTNFNTDRGRAAVDAHYYVSKAAEYFKNNFARQGYDGKGGALNVSVHFDINYVNAYFDGYNQLIFGDGDGRVAGNFAKAFDVVAHEYTHGVTANSAKLAYRDQSGALNESFSDVFGVIIENKTDDLWTMGEDLGIPGQPLQLARSLSNPRLYGQPDTMAQYVNTTADSGGVHTNSGIPNKAFYNIATSMGTEKATKIYYRALTTYLFASSNFADARSAIEKAANDLYGVNEKWYVSKGFYDVGVGVNPGQNPSETQSLKAAQLSSDNPNNTGNYNLTLTIPKNNTAKTIKLTENNSAVILSQAIDASANDVIINKSFSNKAAGTYDYVAEVSDGTNTLTSQIKITVSTTQNPILQPADISVDNATNSGSYTLTIKLPGNNSATKVSLFEGLSTTPIFTQAVNVLQNPITLTQAFTNKPEGTYDYRVDVSDGITTKSSTIKVTVKQSIPSTDTWKENVLYKVGDTVIYKNITYICIQGHTSLVGWTPDVVPALWKKA